MRRSPKPIHVRSNPINLTHDSLLAVDHVDHAPSSSMNSSAAARVRLVLAKVKKVAASFSSCFGRSYVSHAHDVDLENGTQLPQLHVDVDVDPPAPSAVPSGVNTPTGGLTSSVSRNETPSSFAPENMALPASEDEESMLDNGPLALDGSRRSSRSGVVVVVERPSIVIEREESGYGAGSELTASVRTHSRASSPLAPLSNARSSSELQSRRSSYESVGSLPRSMSRSRTNVHQEGPDVSVPSQFQGRTQAQEYQHEVERVQQLRMEMQQQRQAERLSAQSTSIGSDGTSITLNQPLGLTMMIGQQQGEDGDEYDADEPTSPQTITPYLLGRRLHAGRAEAGREQEQERLEGEASTSPEVRPGAPELVTDTNRSTFDARTRAPSQMVGETQDIGHDDDDDDEPTSPQTIRPNTIHMHTGETSRLRSTSSRPATANPDEPSPEPS